MSGIVSIEDCTITDLDLGACRGTRIERRNCRPETLDVTRAALADVDIRVDYPAHPQRVGWHARRDD